MFRFNRKVKKTRVENSFVETESGEYLFNLPSTDIVLKFETVEQLEELKKKLSKYYFREGTLCLLSLLFEAGSDLPIDMIIIVIIILNYNIKWKIWPGLYSYFADELESASRGSFTQFKMLKEKGNHKKIKFKYLMASLFALISFSLAITITNSAFIVYIFESKLFANILLMSVTYELGTTALRLRSVLREI